ncbi:condensation domain-containing protein [Streptomyces sp. NBC_00654]|uniref:condensation domain-containing protein n=1 Tax=Streptomyces sp. NBC_00654 TaxID=2975799 RepID=UPI002254C243|nr:condensation domain-containing protein [Streptomyces sp. NBC_00654]MCX4967003.1 condensation domain-containing protein [Streptomyces sp. NBC_00654]
MRTSPVLDMLAATATAHPEATAIVQGERSLTYRELAAAVPRFAEALAAAGAPPGAHVLLVLDNRPEFAVAYFATAGAGCTVEAIDPDQPEEALRHRLADSHPAVVVTTAGHPVSALTDRPVLIVDGPLPRPPAGTRRRPPGADGPWVTALSSGSTGEPKRVIRTQGHQVAEAGNITSTAGITADDVLLCPVPLFHALGQFCCLLAAARSGATLVLPDRSTGASSVEAVVRALARHRVTLLIAVPHLFDALADLPAGTPADLDAVRLCLSGSNFLPPAVARRFQNRFGLPVRQTYGSTEAGSVCWDVGEDHSPGTVGTPLDGTRVQVTDDNGTPLPLGAEGEIVVSGHAVVNDPGRDHHRTGDLGRLDAHGRLTVVGRSRVLIDTGGHKVNPVEVERVLADHPHIADSGVAGIPLPGTGTLLVAAVRLRDGAPAEPADVLAHCTRHLPAHAVPQRLRMVTEIPRTRLGKVRRTELTALFADEHGADPAGTRKRLAALPPDLRNTEISNHLRRRVAETTGTPPSEVDPGAPPRAAGVDSLAALRLRMAVENELGVRLPLPSLLGPRTLTELARDLAERLDEPEDPTDPIPHGPAEGRFPLAPNQMSLWHADHLDLGGSAYVVAVAARLTGDCDTEALRRAWTTLAHRHPALRTTFPLLDGTPVQRVTAEARVDFAVVPVSPTWDRTHRDDLIHAAFEPFDLTAQPPLRVRLYTGTSGGPVMVVSQHHLITDHWSTIVMLRELAVLHAAETTGSEPYLPAPAHAYSDFAAWSLARQRTPRGADDLSHWVRQLTPLPPPTDLPTDRPRPAVRGQHGATVHAGLSPARVAAVRAHARNSGTTPFAVLLTVFHVLLHTGGGRADSAVAVSTANRERPEFADVLGYFANPVVHRVRMTPHQSFSALLGDVTETLLTGLEHSGVPLENLLGPVSAPRDRGRAPLVEVAFGQNTAHDPALGTVGTLLSADRDGIPVPLGLLTLETFTLRRTGAVYDLTGAVFEGDDSISITWEYDTDLFTRATVNRLATRFETLLDTLLAAPETALGTLSAQAPPTARPPAAASPAEPVTDRVRRWTATDPAALAVVDGTDTATFGDVGRAADLVTAALLARTDLSPSAVVAVHAERPADLAAACLGVLRAGLVCAPVPGADNSPAAGISETGAAALVDMTGSVNAPDTPTVRIGGAPAPRAERPTELRAPALVVHTSGTTGTRRPMVLAHRALANAVHDDERGEVLIARGTADRLALDLLTTLAAGSTAVPLTSAARLEELARGRAAASAAVTPTELTTLLSLLDENGTTPAVRTLIVGGETLGSDLVHRWYSHAPDCRLVHTYGGIEWGLALAGETVPSDTPAETTGPAPGIVPVGRPPAGSPLCTVDAWGRACPVGVPGEICVGAQTPAPLGTAPRSPELPHPLTPDARVRRTGDAGVFLPDGRLIVLGRVGDIHSEHGYHHDPARVERVLRGHPAVRAATVFSGGTAEGTTAAAETDGTVSERRLMDLLRRETPAHLLPRRLLVAARLPRTSDGKAARTLQPPAPARPGTPEPAQDMTAVEATLAGIWRDILGVEHVGPDDDYYTLGGDSVQAVRIAAKAAENGLQVTRRHLFTHPTVRSLARVTTSAAGAAKVSERFARRRSIPLTPVQRWFFELGLPDAGHWNQSVAVRVPPYLTTEALLTAVRTVADHHGVLRHRFRPRGTGWEQVGDPTAQTVEIEEVSAPGDEETSAAIHHARRGVDIAAGPLLRATLISGGAGQRLLVLTAHHLVVDVLSWGVLLSDLRTACDHRDAGFPVRLPPVPLAYNAWARSLREHADRLAVRADLAGWDTPPGSVPGPPPTTYEGGTRVAQRTLGTAHTASLLGGLHHRGAHPADAVLAAAASAAAARLGCHTVRAVMELHGREEVIEGMDPSRTVGWFTALAPLPVDAAPDADPLEVLDSARAARSRDGLEHGMLRYGTSDTTVRSRLAEVDRPWLSVNYLGRLGSVFTGPAADPADAGLVEAPLPDQGDRGPTNHRPFHWEFSAHMTGGELVLRLAHAEDGDGAERLLDTACDYLRTLTNALETTEREESR